MLNPPRWKVWLVVAVCLVGLISLLPNFFSHATLDRLPDSLPKQQITLGLDLQGGAQLLLEVEVADIYRERLESMLAEARVALRAAAVGYRGLGVQGDAVTLTLTDPAQQATALEALAGVNTVLPTAIGFGGIQEFDIQAGEGGRIHISLTPEAREARASAALAQSLEVVRRRIDELGTREASVQRQGEDRILVQVPGERNPEAIKRLLGRTARLTFQMVDMESNPEDVRAGRVPGSVLLPAADDSGGSEYVVRRRIEVSGEELVDAQPSFQDNQPVVSFRFDSSGARKFGRITQENVNRLFAIVLDGRVISAPRIREPILGGSGIISGSFTVESANELAVLLRAGALPAPMTVVEERSVGPELGADSIRAGAYASIVALVLVMAAMLVYYGVFGVVANLALVVNLVLIFGIMSLLGATLTLPGIAGIVLTIGAAVDSNVLIYERIREEAKRGRSPLSSIDSGFNEALRTIVDANLTTLIAALALFQFGSGPVRGFAVTLGIGIATTMFTAVTFTRLVVAYWYRRARPAAIPL
ncbi:MAG TPA: protein translocase subunit SecD [Geminicoccaceae bacterium]|nr:protein translocase subunit SecD [Geminicoccaceae bacterium]